MSRAEEWGPAYVDPEASDPANAIRKPGGIDDLPPAMCPTCCGPVIRAIDTKFGNLRYFEPAPLRTGQFRIHNGRASWWGSTGAEFRKHQCPGRTYPQAGGPAPTPRPEVALQVPASEPHFPIRIDAPGWLEDSGVDVDRIVNTYRPN